METRKKCSSCSWRTAVPISMCCLRCGLRDLPLSRMISRKPSIPLHSGGCSVQPTTTIAPSAAACSSKHLRETTAIVIILSRQTAPFSTISTISLPTVTRMSTSLQETPRSLPPGRGAASYCSRAMTCVSHCGHATDGWASMMPLSLLPTGPRRASKLGVF